MAQPDQLIDRERLLEEFDLVTEASVAALFGIDVKTLKNRPRSQQPSFSKVGAQRLYHKKSVIEFLERTTAEAAAAPKPQQRRATPGTRSSA